MRSPTKTKKRKQSTVVRRSFALPTRLVEQVSEAAPPEYRGNLNAVVRQALEEYVKKRDEEELDADVERMAADPQIQAINNELNHAFRHTLKDGLPDDPSW